MSEPGVGGGALLEDVWAGWSVGFDVGYRYGYSDGREDEEAWLDVHGHRRPLALLDTLAKIMPPSLPGENAYQRDYRVGSRLKAMIDPYPGATLAAVHHIRKATLGGDLDWMDSTSGTNGMNGAADATVNLSRPRGESAGLLRVTGRDVLEGEYAVSFADGAWTLDGHTLAAAAMAAEQLRVTASLGDRSAEIVKYVTEKGSVTPKQVAEALEIPDARRYLARLADAHRLSKEARGLYTPVPTVPLPEGFPDSPTLSQEGGGSPEWDNGTVGKGVLEGDNPATPRPYLFAAVDVEATS